MANKVEDIARDSANKEYPPEYEMSDDNWRQRAGYVKGFKAGVEWARQNPEYKPMPVVYEDDTISGQPCELCPFRAIPDADTCSSLFVKRFGVKCSKYALRFAVNSLT